MRRAWVVPETLPTSRVTVTFTLPDDATARGILRAVLLDLSDPESWEVAGGTVTVEQCAAQFEQTLDEYEASL